MLHSTANIESRTCGCAEMEVRLGARAARQLRAVLDDGRWAHPHHRPDLQQRRARGKRLGGAPHRWQARGIPWRPSAWRSARCVLSKPRTVSRCARASHQSGRDHATRAADDQGHCYAHAGLPGEEGIHRITLVCAFWDDSLVPAEGQPGSGPARLPPWRQQAGVQPETPACTESSYLAGTTDVQANGAAHARQCSALSHAGHYSPAFAGWLAACEHCTVSTQDWSVPQSVKQVALICPVWLALGEATTAKRKRQRIHAGGVHCMCAPLPPLMFFLRSADDIRRVYNYI